MKRAASGASTALVAGASGLVGGECLRLLIASRHHERITVLTRRDLGRSVRHRKVHQVIAEFGRLDEVREQLVADHVFCALGTTMKKAGSREKFRAVDMDYPLELARLCRSEGAGHFSIVSALGASRSSPFFYSRVKGEVEAALREMHWPSLAIFRPSVIAGDRGESRPFERVSEQLLNLAPATWRPVQASDIAAAMVAVAIESPPGVTIVESRDISSLSTR